MIDFPKIIKNLSLKKIVNYFAEVTLNNRLQSLSHFTYKVYEDPLDNGYTVFRVVFYVRANTYEITSSDIDEIVTYIETVLNKYYA